MKYELKELDNLPEKEFTEKFATIPKDCTILDLRDNQLFNKGGVVLENVIKTIPGTVTLLDLSNNNLGKLSADQLAALIRAIPETVKKINLNGNKLNKVDDLAKVFAAISKGVTGLSLDNNQLDNVETEKLRGAFKAISANLTHLSLASNYFGRLRGGLSEDVPDPTSEELASIFAAIPESVTWLNLSNNPFRHLKTKGQLAQVFASISKNVTSLFLRNNFEFADLGKTARLFTIEEEEIPVAFSHLSKSLDTLDLSDNKIPESILDKIKKAITGRVKSLVFDDETFDLTTSKLNEEEKESDLDKKSEPKTDDEKKQSDTNTKTEDSTKKQESDNNKKEQEPDNKPKPNTVDEKQQTSTTTKNIDSTQVDSTKKPNTDEKNKEKTTDTKTDNSQFLAKLKQYIKHTDWKVGNYILFKGGVNNEGQRLPHRVSDILDLIKKFEKGNLNADEAYNQVIKKAQEALDHKRRGRHSTTTQFYQNLLCDDLSNPKQKWIDAVDQTSTQKKGM